MTHLSACYAFFFFLLSRRPPGSPLFPYTTLFRSLMADDFWGERQWEVFHREIKRVLPGREFVELPMEHPIFQDRKSTRLNSSHSSISYAVFCLKKKNQNPPTHPQSHKQHPALI